MNTPLRYDRAEIVRTFNLLVGPGAITELRALDATLRGSNREGTVSGYFDSAERLAGAVETIQTAKGVYIIPNLVDPVLLSRAVNRVRLVNKREPLTGDEGITRRNWLLIDADPARPSGISATDEEHETARLRADQVREHLRSQGWPEPIFADSGNGFHLLYRIDLPRDDGGLVGRCLEALSARFSDSSVTIDTAVGNAARIWKLYGTMARKGDHTVERPHRLARLVDVPDPIAIVAMSLLESFAATAPSAATMNKSAARKKAGASVAAFDLDDWMTTHLPDAAPPKPWKDGGRIWELASCPFSQAHTDGAFVAQLPSGAISAGCHHNSCAWQWADLRDRFEPDGGGESDDDDNGRTQAQQILALVKSMCRLGQSERGEAFAVFNSVPSLAVMLDSPEFKDQIALMVHERLDFVITGSLFSDVVAIMRAQARQMPREIVHVRVARAGDAVVLDLGTPSGEVAVVEPGGWAVRAKSPVLFVRTVLIGALPPPAQSGSLDELRALLNVTEATWPCLLGWLVAAFLADIAHPILLGGGVQGSGKTTGLRIAVSCIDPSPAGVRSPPRSPDDWAVTQAGCWASVIDNISTIPDWWSDALCKAVTGDGWVKRSLYTNASIAVLAFRRVLALTSIDAGALRGDLGERLAIVDFEVIEPANRLSETALLRRFEKSQGRILGALLDLIARVLERLATVKVADPPRMADYAHVLVAMDAVLGTSAYRLYRDQAHRIAGDVLESDPVGTAVMAFMADRSMWTGTCQNLLSALVTPNGIDRKEWPRTPRRLSGHLKRLVPALGIVGIRVVRPAETDKTRTWSLVREERATARTAQPPEKAAGTAPEPSGHRAVASSDRPSNRPTHEPAPESASGDSGRSGGLGGSTSDSDEERLA